MSRPALERLAEVFSLDPTRVARPASFDAAIADAIAIFGSFDAVVAELLEGGPIRGARWPWGVVLARLRALPEAYIRRQAALAERREAAR